MHKLALALFAGLICSGCISRVADMTIVSTKNVDARKPHYTDTKHRVTGETMRTFFLIIPDGEVNIKESIDRAIENAPGAVALANVTIDYGWWYIPIICACQWYTVEGDPVFESEEDMKAMRPPVRQAVRKR